MNRGIFEMRKN